MTSFPGTAARGRLGGLGRCAYVLGLLVQPSSYVGVTIIKFPEREENENHLDDNKLEHNKIKFVLGIFRFIVLSASI